MLNKIMEKIGYISLNEYNELCYKNNVRRENILKELEDYKKKNFHLVEKNSDLTKSTVDLSKKLEELNCSYKNLLLGKNDLEKKYKRVTAAKGGIVKENNALRKKVEELTKKLEESMSNKYLIKKLPPEKIPSQKRVFRSSAKTSKIIKQIHWDGEK